ncbi:hypothetical protein DL98DRAFT_652887 [Cadophora sp. DSE1049]|nr:hypothetical protein DL98DRAFT_652887 [Cadophora sp. DSE1049]
MDMPIASEWPPVVSSMTDLPITDPRCINESCTAFYAALNASQTAIPYDSLDSHSHWMVWCFMATISVFALAHAYQVFRDRSDHLRNCQNRPLLPQKILALVRYVSYSHISGSLPRSLGLPLNGTLILLLALIIFVTTLTFGVRPYYREHYGYGSPPLAIQTGFMSLACVPVLIALAGKANIITLLTGISHEKLNIVHRFVAWVSFSLAWCHTIPFFWISYTDGGYENVKIRFFMGSGGTTEWGGVPPLINLFLLCILSLPIIRYRIYESFYYSHIVLSISYLGLLFWHAGNILDSWAYLWATLALWLASWTARALWYTQPTNIKNKWLVSSSTAIFELTVQMTRIEMLAPRGFQFSPAQHCFLRFPSISYTDSHPFTIVSAPVPSTRGFHGREYQQTLVFLARSHEGFTKKLANYYASHPNQEVQAWIEGPYGGICRPIERVYDTLILVAGGTGITACLPWLEYVTSKAENIRCLDVVLIWVMREREHAAWAEPTLEMVATRTRTPVLVKTRFFVTSAPAIVEAPEADEENPKTELPGRDSDLQSAGHPIQLAAGRPYIGALIEEEIMEGKNFVFGCGPEGMRSDIANACSKAQKRVMRGEIQEVALHLEALGW